MHRLWTFGLRMILVPRCCIAHFVWYVLFLLIGESMGVTREVDAQIERMGKVEQARSLCVSFVSASWVRLAQWPTVQMALGALAVVL